MLLVKVASCNAGLSTVCYGKVAKPPTLFFFKLYSLTLKNNIFIYVCIKKEKPNGNPTRCTTFFVHFDWSADIEVA